MVRLAALLCLWAGSAFAQLLGDGQYRREIPLQVVDGKPLLAVTVNGQAGVMMLDNGTPEVVMFNRDAVDLGPGQEVGRGNAASGQPVVVMLHDAAEMTIAGQSFALSGKVFSGDLGFVEAGFGPAFMGFIGTPALEVNPFSIDFAQKKLIVIRAGQLDLPPEDVRGRIVFSIWPGEQPTSVAQIGGTAMLLDFDTGDGGTLYLRDETLASLVAAGHLTGGPDLWELSGLRIGGVGFAKMPVRLVQAGGPKDYRKTGASDFLRLGAGFLAMNPVLWNFSDRELVFLTPDAQVLAAE